MLKTASRQEPHGSPARFIVVGAGAAALLGALLFGFASLGMAPFPASVLAYGVAFAVAYTAQRSWTFRGRHAHSHALPRYFTLQFGCALLSGVLSELWTGWLGVSPFAMSALTTVAVSAFSYFMSSCWVFSRNAALAGR